MTQVMDWVAVRLPLQRKEVFVAIGRTTLDRCHLIWHDGLGHGCEVSDLPTEFSDGENVEAQSPRGDLSVR